jgi:glycosyltransferase involved in cell wall biosynthesis
MRQPETAILHYTAPPVVGGVEAVIQAHTHTFIKAGYPVTIIAGRGEESALPSEANFVSIPMIDSLHPRITRASSLLEQGEVPSDFDDLTNQLLKELRPILSHFDNVIVHNVFTKHFNLPLTAALYQLLDGDELQHLIAWCHDFTWTSPSSRSKVHPGYPWDLLRTYHPDITYVAVSERRQQALANLLDRPPAQIHVVYNGINPRVLLGLSAEGYALITRLDLLESDLILLMPVRVTQAKNIEYALHLVAALKASDYSPKLIVTGPPDPHDAKSMAYFESLRALRQELGVEKETHFVFESGPDPKEPLYIDERVVGDLFRVSDIMFMPSHREGFGMPILEAGLVGIPALCTDVPAAEEIGAQDVVIFDPDDSPVQLTEQILDWAEQSSIYNLRSQLRRRYTWTKIFQQDIKPLLNHPGKNHNARHL